MIDPSWRSWTGMVLVVLGLTVLVGCGSDEAAPGTSGATDAAGLDGGEPDAGTLDSISSDTDETPDTASGDTSDPDDSTDTVSDAVTDALTDAETDAATDILVPGEVDAPDAGNDTADTTPEGDTGSPGELLTAMAGPYAAEPGAEATLCVNKNLGNDAAARIKAIHTHLGQGSHHMIVSLVNQPGPVDVVEPCSPFDGGIGGSNTVFIAEQPEASLVYPDGTALNISANQQVRIEVHYFNYYPDPIDVVGSVDFELAPEDAGPTIGVDIQFTGSLSLTLPPGEKTVHKSFHKAKSGARVFAMTSHTHRLGIKATIHRATSVDSPTELLHESLDWSDPPLDQFDPPLEFQSGEGFLLTCEYENTTDETVHFGLSATAEMCFLWAHYYVP